MPAEVVTADVCVVSAFDCRIVKLHMLFIYAVNTKMLLIYAIQKSYSFKHLGGGKRAPCEILSGAIMSGGHCPGLMSGAANVQGIMSVSYAKRQFFMIHKLRWGFFKKESCIIEGHRE